jgi:hypothetical protein
MGTLKQGARKISRNLRKDFNVDLEDFKQMLGMGQGGYMPALSLFAMPAVDLSATRRSRTVRGWSSQQGLAAGISALTQLHSMINVASQRSIPRCRRRRPQGARQPCSTRCPALASTVR